MSKEISTAEEVRAALWAEIDARNSRVEAFREYYEDRQEVISKLVVVLFRDHKQTVADMPDLKQFHFESEQKTNELICQLARLQKENKELRSWKHDVLSFWDQRVMPPEEIAELDRLNREFGSRILYRDEP